jgi:CRISPR/Cas system-associated exonuclease Cas4 (RecB family)
MAETSTGPVEPRPTFLVTDLKQFAYCPRVVYYSYCLPLIRPTTYKMQAGQEAHLEEEGREQRRSLRAYGLEEGERTFNLWLQSSELGLRGRMDMVSVSWRPTGCCWRKRGGCRCDGGFCTSFPSGGRRKWF